jgi:hypothetical protein
MVSLTAGGSWSELAPLVDLGKVAPQPPAKIKLAESPLAHERVLDSCDSGWL